MGLLVEAHERCRGPEDAGEPALDRDGFKRLVRDLDLWCSSSMVAFEGREPVGVLLGAKRAEATLVYASAGAPRAPPPGARKASLDLAQPEARHPWAPAAASPRSPPSARRRAPSSRPVAFSSRAVSSIGAGTRSSEVRRERGARGAGAGERRGSRSRRPPGNRPGAAGSGTCRRSKSTRSASPAWPSTRRTGSRPGLSGTTGTLWAVGAAPGPFGRIGLPVILDEINAPVLLPRATPEELAADLLAELGFESGPDHLLFTSQAQAA